ncbi:DMT family transporter [Dendrosporobacter sp. 1207_IL3150]|uniref:DMT family transporter n=1 Tax=Dendrosporobacter sp. 1207_IL3150 TaxID=3084054 RepID=UPI002FDA182F
MSKNNLGAIYLSGAASIWGGLYVVSKFALDIVPPFTLMFLRYLISFLVLALICKYTNTTIIPRLNKITLFQIGFCGYFLSIAAQFIGTKLSSAHMGAVITTLSPVFQSAFAIWLLREKITSRQLLSIALSFVGVMIINGVSGFGSTGSSQEGALFLLIAALFWGYYSVLAKKISHIYSALQITTFGILVATVASFPVAAYEFTNINFALLISWPIILSILYLAVISTAVAFFLWNKGLALVPSHQAGLFFFLQPLVGSFLGWALLDEHLNQSFFIGTALILAAVYIVMSGTTSSKISIEEKQNTSS